MEKIISEEIVTEDNIDYLIRKYDDGATEKAAFILEEKIEAKLKSEYIIRIRADKEYILADGVDITTIVINVLDGTGEHVDNIGVVNLHINSQKFLINIINGVGTFGLKTKNVGSFKIFADYLYTKAGCIGSNYVRSNMITVEAAVSL